MKGGVLRVALVAVGSLSLAGAAGFAAAGCAAFAWRLGVIGLVLTLGIVFERWRYRRLAPAAPGDGWVATGERFVDPETNKLVTVYHEPATGARRYVAQ